MKSKTRYHCPHFGCKKSYTRRDYVERHAVNHMVTKPYICLVCDRYFSRADLFEHHMDTKYHRKRAEKHLHPDHPWQAPEQLVSQDFDASQQTHQATFEPSEPSVPSSTEQLASPSDQNPQNDSYFVYQQQKHESSYYYPSQPMFVAGGGGVPVPRGSYLGLGQNQTISQQLSQTQPLGLQTLSQQQPMLMSQHGPLTNTHQVYPWLPSQANPIHYV